MKSKRIALIGGAFGLLIVIGASLGGVLSSSDSMAETMAHDEMAETLAHDGMAETMAPAETLSDGKVAMIAVVADNIDISYAHLAMARSSNPDVRRFAQTMLQDHAAVNEQAGALVGRLGIEPVESDVSRQLQEQARTIIDELTTLRGERFEGRYAENELSYHEFVNAAVRDQFIPALQSDELREALKGALAVFEGHERLARSLVESVDQ